MRATALTILLSLPMLAAAAVTPAPVAGKNCRIETDAKGNRAAKCVLAESKGEAKAAAPKADARKSAKSKVLDCRDAATPSDKLLCLAVREGEPEAEVPAPGNEIG
jgi:hypothetical protein